jgi:hypothetical protein
VIEFIVEKSSLWTGNFDLCVHLECGRFVTFCYEEKRS